MPQNSTSRFGPTTSLIDLFLAASRSALVGRFTPSWYVGVMVRKVLTATGALLAGFHVWLFVSQIGDGRLADVSVLARWAVAVFLVAALWYLRRQNVSMFWGRQAVAV